MGAVKSAYIDKCPITGNQAHFWITTDELPKKLEKELTTKEKIEALKDLVLPIINIYEARLHANQAVSKPARQWLDKAYTILKQL